MLFRYYCYNLKLSCLRVLEIQSNSDPSSLYVPGELNLADDVYGGQCVQPKDLAKSRFYKKGLEPFFPRKL